MDHRPCVHIVAGWQGGIYATLHLALGSTSDIRRWTAVPPAHAVRPGDLLVVDLNDAAPSTNPRRLQVLLGRAALYLIPGDAPIAPSWLELASQPDVHVLPSNSAHGRRGDAAVVGEVLRLMQGPSDAGIGDLVLRAEPGLRVLESLVHVVCLGPWYIRRPRDLARRSGISPAELKRRCARVGFARVEHFIICVRLVAYEQLVAVHRLPIGTARLLAGFGDSSNMRRHAKRAAQRSPPVARVLESLHAARLDAFASRYTVRRSPERAASMDRYLR